jgi:hypothetical protein
MKLNVFSTFSASLDVPTIAEFVGRLPTAFGYVPLKWGRIDTTECRNLFSWVTLSNNQEQRKLYLLDVNNNN